MPVFSSYKTSQLICTANQLAGFYMRTTLAFNGLSMGRAQRWISWNTEKRIYVLINVDLNKGIVSKIYLKRFSNLIIYAARFLKCAWQF